MLTMFMFVSFTLFPLLICTPINPINNQNSELEEKTMNIISTNTIDDSVLEVLKPEPYTQLEHDENGQCIFLKTEPGVYSYVSPGTEEVCGFYVIAHPEFFTVFEFEDFDVSCSPENIRPKSVLSVIDGWELNGQFFPGSEDHSLTRKERYTEYCGSDKPWKQFRMSQNVGLLEFRILTKGEGFRVKVSFIKNHEPCNAVLQEPQGIYTLKNYGRRRNCTVSIIFPERISVISLNVAALQKREPIEAIERIERVERMERMEPTETETTVETGIVKNCKENGLKDYIEIKGGDGLDPGLMMVAENFCGLESTSGKLHSDVACGNTAIRLVSSGQYDNSVTIGFDLLLDFSSPSLICPAFIEAL